MKQEYSFVKQEILLANKERIRNLRIYRNMEFINGNLLLYVFGLFLQLEHNRYGDRFYIINEKIKNLKNCRAEDFGLDLEHYFEPGITDDPKLFPKLVKTRRRYSKGGLYGNN